MTSLREIASAKSYEVWKQQQKDRFDPTPKVRANREVPAYKFTVDPYEASVKTPRLVVKSERW